MAQYSDTSILHHFGVARFEDEDENEAPSEEPRPTNHQSPITTHFLLCTVSGTADGANFSW
jgi:hypothetical protein